MKLTGRSNFWKKSWECKNWSTCTISNGLWKYVIKMGGLFIKFVAKGAKTWENRKTENGKKWIFKSNYLLNVSVQ